MDFEMTLLKLSSEGYQCAQIMVILALDLVGETNPGLVRAMSGLNAGLGKSGSACGVLTGGAAALGYFTGKADPSDMPHEKAEAIVADYSNWFRAAYGSDRCQDIIDGDFTLAKTHCVGMIEAAYDKIIELLQAYELLDA